MDDEFAKFFGKLRSQTDEGHRAWKELLAHPQKIGAVDCKQLQALIQLAANIDDPIQFRSANCAILRVLAEKTLPTAIKTSSPGSEKSLKSKDGRADPTAKQRITLADWLRDPFSKAGLVFSATCALGDARHPGPSFYAGRILDRAFARDVRCVHFAEGGQVQWRQAIEDRNCRAVFILGPLEDFGADARENLAAKRSRYRVTASPTGTGKRSLVETIRNSDTRFHEPDNSDGGEVDYAFVQRYTTFLGGKKLAVVHLAGCTALGTLGAARWACEDLAASTSFESRDPIFAPSEIRPSSHLQALLRVTASSSMHAWDPRRVEQLQLWVDDSLWDIKSHDWVTPSHDLLTIVSRDGAPTYYKLDGQRRNALTDGNMFKTIVALAEEKLRTGRPVIDRKSLARRLDVTEGELGQVLPQVRFRHLKGELLLRGDSIELIPDVEFVHKTSITANAALSPPMLTCSTNSAVPNNQTRKKAAVTKESVEQGATKAAATKKAAGKNAKKNARKPSKSPTKKTAKKSSGDSNPGKPR
jgi:hypothetical protein